MDQHSDLRPRNRAELAEQIQRTDTVAIREPELRGIFNLHLIEDLAHEFVFREASFGREDHLGVADVRLRGILRDFNPHGRTLNEMIRSPEAIDFMREVIGERRYCEGAQIHRMTAGSSLPAHRHGDDDVFAIFHFGRTYSGGAYFEERNGIRNYPAIPPYSLFISRGIIIHGVEPVTAGERLVLVTCWTQSSHKS